VTQSNAATDPPVTVYGPDFPFAYDQWITHPDGIGTIPESAYGTEIAIIGGGVSGMIAAYELMKLGLKPVIYEVGRLGGRLRSEQFANANDGIVAELGGMRFPVSATTFDHYRSLLGLQIKPFPNPLTTAAGSTVIDLAGETVYAESIDDLPPIYREVAEAWNKALETEAQLIPLKQAIRDRDAKAIKACWDPLVRTWDDRTFYDFIATAPSFKKLDFRHREIFGQVGFGTGGWDSDFRNTMLEILRVVLTECDDSQHYIVGGSEQLPRKLWTYQPDNLHHWPAGTSLSTLHGGATKPGVVSIDRRSDDLIAVTDQYDNVREYKAHGRQAVLERPRPDHTEVPHEYDADRPVNARHLLF